MFDLLLLIDDLYVSVGHFAADPACIGMRLLILKVLQMLFTAMRSWHQPPETGRIEMDVEEQIRAHAEAVHVFVVMLFMCVVMVHFIPVVIAMLIGLNPTSMRTSPKAFATK